ncbi:C4-dicarboxylate transporter DcuC [Vibrio sp. JC009]|uniref:C4-dicarboxylate transporter DcuC n=1 Tax=Vibrio sp. JC009 TaxID=2912314 RepID=UPI0023AFA50F|nr:C4-dicarboxylate transporter DcuC [Vibrio sp. JC009]WED22194.1 C4-dicarboxylate transporter DcuC [Vibrio sp. JC009]
MEPTIYELIIALCVVVALGWLILKQYYPQAVLTIAGIILYLSSHWINGTPIIADSSGLAILDVFIKLKDIFAYRTGGLGLVIMSVAGFAAYMSHIGAAQALVKVSVKPVSMISNPWITLALAYLIGIFVSLFITSATGLGLLLMVTLYPIMRGAGISKASAVGVIATSQAFEIGHVQSNLIRAAEAIEMSNVDYFVDYQALVAVIMVFSTMLVHVWWQRRCDAKDGWDPRQHVNEPEEVEEGKVAIPDAPSWYAIFPLFPFVLMLFFSKLVLGNPAVIAWVKEFWPGYPLQAINLDVVVAMLVPAILAMVIHGIRGRSFKQATDGYKVFLEGMGSVFASVVVLIVAAQLFADALKDMGAVTAFLNFASGLGVNGIGMIIVSTALIAFAAVLMGSGNASFMSFVEIAPTIATKFGIAKISVMLPMQMGSSIGRSMSPIAAVIVAAAGIAGISTTEVVRRTIVPMLSALVTCLVLTIAFYY